MILATHAVVGAAAASIFPNHPIIAFTAGFASHFVVDAIPHWHYPVSSFELDPNDHMDDDMSLRKGFLKDLTKFAADAMLGLILSYFIFSSFRTPLLVILAGVAGGILPDPLQFAYWKWRHEPLVSLQRFHIWIHSGKNIDHKHLSGILSQIAVGIIVVLFAKILIR